LALVAFRPDVERSGEARWAAAGQAALRPFKRQLQTALQQGLAKGPESAIDACRSEAPRVAWALTTETKRVGRTSHRLRNPANAPKPWMQPILEELQAAAPGAIAYRVAPIEPGWVGYAEPIYLQPPCLTCHGTSIRPSIARELEALYPEDRATGFSVGDFRGLFWVELATGGER
jgi:hypothetical protein